MADGARAIDGAYGSGVRERSSSDGLCAVLDALGTAVLLVDGKGSIGYANHRACELLREDATELVGRPLADLVSIATLEARAAEAAVDTRASARIQRRDGSTFEAGFTLADANLPGRPGHRAITFQDISSLVRLREERDRLLQLATVGEVLPSVLHEAKNPLAAAMTAVEVVLEETADRHLQEELHAVLVEIRRAVLTLDGLGSAGLDPLSCTPAAVDHAVREVVTVLAHRAQRLGIRLEAAVPDLPLLPLSPSVLRAATFNLLQNALQACRAGDAVRVEASLEGGLLTVAIVDTGSGMTPEVLARCTELFFTTKRSGSGIGLALCKEIASKAGGELRVDSTPSRGTRVELVLPARARPSTHRPSAGVSPPHSP